MIDEVLITSGGVNLANYSGEYMSAVAQRDFSEGKKKLWDKTPLESRLEVNFEGKNITHTVINSINLGLEPIFDKEDEAIIYQLTRELYFRKKT